MCKQDTVLQTLKTMSRSGLNKCSIMLAEAQAEDYKNMDSRIDGIENKVNNIDKKVDDVLLILQRQQSLYSSIKSFIKNPITLWLLALVLIKIFGVEAMQITLPLLDKL